VVGGENYVVFHLEVADTIAVEVETDIRDPPMGRRAAAGKRGCRPITKRAATSAIKTKPLRIPNSLRFRNQRPGGVLMTSTGPLTARVRSERITKL
jgi:hypothetical protein